MVTLIGCLLPSSQFRMDGVKSELIGMGGNTNLPRNENIPVFLLENGFDSKPEVTVMVNEATLSVDKPKSDNVKPTQASCPPAYGEVCSGEMVRAASANNQPISIVVNNGHNLRSFHGYPEEDVDEFFRDFESYFTTTKLQENQKLDRLVSSLAGAAKRCFWANKVINPELDYEKMKALVTRAFKAQRPGLFNRATMENRKQYPNESVESYIWDKVALCQKVEPPMVEKEIIQVVLAGLRDPQLVAQLYAQDGLDTFDKFHSKLQMLSEGMKFALQNQEVVTFNALEAQRPPEAMFLPKLQGSGPPPATARQDSRGRFRGRGRGRFRGKQFGYSDSRGQQRKPRYEPGNLENIQCWGCEQFGHYRRDCPNDETKNQFAAGRSNVASRQMN